MKKRILGVAAIALIGLGLWLSRFWNGPGLGGSGAGKGESPQVSLNAQSHPHETSISSEPQTAAAPDDVLSVLIEADQYHIQQGPDEQPRFDVASLEDLVRRARDVTGGKYGVKVRLRFRRNAQEGTISNLYRALQEAGLERESIIEDSDYVD